jgi:hypothetical protein
MSREKSPLTPQMIFILGKILFALTGTIINEDIIRTVCRNTGITAIGQGELSSSLKEFRSALGTEPQEKLHVLAEILPEGFLLSLLSVAQEFVSIHGSKLYQADVESNMDHQSKLISLENDKSEAQAAVIAKNAECETLTMKLHFEQQRVTQLAECNIELGKENSFLLGRLQERDQINTQKPTVARRRSKVKTPTAADSKNRPMKTPEEAQPTATLITPLMS